MRFVSAPAFVTFAPLALVAVIAGFASACATAAVSSEPPEKSDGGATGAKGDGGSGGGKSDAGVKTPPDSGGGPVTDDGGTTVVDDSTCATSSTRQSCEQCCLNIHPTGYDVYHQELVSCACQAPGPCATVCATEFCVQKPTTPGDACEQCITGSLAQGAACYDGVANACQSDTDCTALFQGCIPPCETK
jgi:hypothetical protein